MNQHNGPELYPTIFAIKLSDKGIKKFVEIYKKSKTRSDNKKDDRRIESYKDEHRYELKLQQKFNKDKKKAEELGVSIEDYLGIELFTKRLMPEFNKDESREDRFRKDMFERSYIEFLKEKGIDLNREHVRNTILKLLSTLKK